jgi:hypothetical protein
MHIDPSTILELLHELEVGDPLDFGNLSISEEDARNLVAVSLSKLSQDLAQQGLSSESREALALATAARLLLDNLTLHYRLLALQGAAPTDAKALLEAIRTSSLKR